ncbi:Metallo-dependent phosphatase [Pyrenochaeta sp. DS3sAY3a]|nr:Metallo-dependent phosphatase [Pyrenochaeta sp. DS3sAY3a]
MSQKPLSKNNLFHPTPPTPWQQFLRHPSLFFAHWLYTHQSPLSTCSTPPSQRIKAVCISDTHNTQPALPHGDILIHAGDLTINGTAPELQDQLTWLDSLPYAYKLVVARNHDILLDAAYCARSASQRLYGSPDATDHERLQLDWGSITYLQNESATLDIRGRMLRVYGAPLTPQYGNWAFQYPRHEDVWTFSIPQNTDILITHGPAKGHLDDGGKGCAHLNAEMWRVKPSLHICGHIHSARGVETADWGWVRWGYDTIVRGEERWITELVMLGAWVAGWMVWGVSGRMERGVVGVNAAAKERRQEGYGGMDGTVVEI